MADKMSPKTSMFGFKAFKKYPELVPLVIFVSMAVTGAVSFIAHALIKKPDVRLIRSRGPPHEDVEPTEIRKFYDRHPEIYKPKNKEFEDLKEDLKLGPTKK